MPATGMTEVATGMMEVATGITSLHGMRSDLQSFSMLYLAVQITLIWQCCLLTSLPLSSISTGRAS